MFISLNDHVTWLLSILNNMASHINQFLFWKKLEIYLLLTDRSTLTIYRRQIHENLTSIMIENPQGIL